MCWAALVRGTKPQVCLLRWEAGRGGLDDLQGLGSSSFRVDLKMLWRRGQASAAVEKMRMISAICCQGHHLSPCLARSTCSCPVL